LDQRDYIKNSLKIYSDLLENISNSFLNQQLKMIEEFRAFIDSSQEVFLRKNLPGHFTASSFILCKERKKLLMTHHLKLNKWLQLGGHADGESVLHQVALNEAFEESGLDDVRFLNYNFFPNPQVPLIFDIDCHFIPKNSKDPEHYHFDVRYLLCIDHDQEVKISGESLDLRWIDLHEVYLYNNEPPIARCISKIKKLHSQLI